MSDHNIDTECFSCSCGARMCFACGDCSARCLCQDKSYESATKREPAATSQQRQRDDRARLAELERQSGCHEPE